MPNATNAQVQAYADNFVRPVAEKVRALVESMKDAKALIDDVYANLTSNPTWTDGRTDSPPRLLAPADVLAWNTFVANAIASLTGDAQYPVVLKCCARGLGV